MLWPLVSLGKASWVGEVQRLGLQERRKGELFYSHFLRLVPNWVPREAGSGGSRALPGCGSQGNGMELF